MRKGRCNVMMGKLHNERSPKTQQHYRSRDSLVLAKPQNDCYPYGLFTVILKQCCSLEPLKLHLLSQFHENRERCNTICSLSLLKRSHLKPLVDQTGSSRQLYSKVTVSTATLLPYKLGIGLLCFLRKSFKGCETVDLVPRTSRLRYERKWICDIEHKRQGVRRWDLGEGVSHSTDAIFSGMS